MGTNQFGVCLSVMEMLRFADSGTEEPETGRVTVHVTSCESCRKTVMEVINWLNARDERRASSSLLSRNIVNLTGRKPLVMYSDELEAARPAINFNPDAPMVAESVACTQSPYFDPEVAAKPPAERVQYLSKRYSATICDVRVVNVPKEVLDLVMVEVCRLYCCVPLYLTEDKQLVICVADPSNFFVKEQIYFSTGYEVGVCGVGIEIASEEDIKDAIERLYVPPKEARQFID